MMINGGTERAVSGLIQELEKPADKIFFKDAALVSVLHPHPSGSSDTQRDDHTELEKPAEKTFIKDAVRASNFHPRPSTKKKIEADLVDVCQGTEELPKNIYIKNAVLVPILNPQPTTSTASRSDNKMIAKKRKKEAAQDEEPQKPEPCLEKCYLENAAVLPKLCLRPASFAANGVTTRESDMEQPLRIHGLSIPMYQRVYHSVVDPRLMSSTGQLHCYSVELGRKIKQRLYKRLKCPALIEENKKNYDGQIHYVEKFSTPTKQSCAPHLELDSSHKPKPEEPKRKKTQRNEKEIAKKRKKEAAQDEEPQKPEPCLERCYLENAAVLPKLCLRPASFAANGVTTRESDMEQPLRIHGLSIPMYQRVYHSVVDSRLMSSTGQLHCYSVELGRKIKQRLYKRLKCPALIEDIKKNDDGQIHYVEKFSTPTQQSCVPHVELDTSHKPKPEEPKKKRTQRNEKEIAKKRKKEAAQDEEPQKPEPCLEKCYLENTAVLPKLCLRPASFAANGVTTRESDMEQPLRIHGLSIPMYQRVYHSVVDPSLLSSTGQLHCYSVELGRKIKQRLYKRLKCPALIEDIKKNDDGQIHYVEKFSTPTQQSCVPHVELDTSHKPKPEEPKKKRTQRNEKETVQKGKIKAKGQVDVHLKPKKHPQNTLNKNAVVVPILKPQPTTSTASSTNNNMIARKREAAQMEKLQKLEPSLEKRYLVNAAILPKFCPRPASFAATTTGTTTTGTITTTRESDMEQPLRIHSLSVPMYQRVYHSVVDPRLVSSTGQPHCYSVELGRKIKQRLRKRLKCPSLIEEMKNDGKQIHYVEKFSPSTQQSFAPHFELDTSHKPKPEQPKKRKTQTKEEEIVRQRKGKAEGQIVVHLKQKKQPNNTFNKNAFLISQPKTFTILRTDNKMIVQKRKSEAEGQVDVHLKQKEHPKNTFNKNAVMVPILKSQPTSVHNLF